MNYYYDCEFREGYNKPFIGKPRHSIDLISIGIVAQDGREYYAISSDFDLKAAWNAWQPGKGFLVDGGMEKRYPREYWLRENVLRPIYDELLLHHMAVVMDARQKGVLAYPGIGPFSIKSLKKLIDLYGKSNARIAGDIVMFAGPRVCSMDLGGDPVLFRGNPIFCGYYSAYDHVALCTLFGTMMNLPEGFPMYTYDLKQKLDDRAHTWDVFQDVMSDAERIKLMKGHKDYPQNPSEHSAIHDARWNKALDQFINSI